MQIKDFGEFCKVAFEPHQKEVAIMQTSLDSPNRWIVGKTTRQFDYESGWMPSKDWTLTIKTYFDKNSALKKIKELAKMKSMKESRLYEAARYKAPEDPFLKFRSDLARELTAKHFPVWSYHKHEKKVFRSPLAIVNAGRMGSDGRYSFIKLSKFGSDTCAVEVGDGNGFACYIESEGKGEEWFQNTNSAIPSEGYSTDQNFYYQGPTWCVRGAEDYKAKDFKKEGLARNQIADAVIECLKVALPNRDFAAEWDEMIVEIDEKIKDKQAYVDEYTAKLAADPNEIDTGDGAWKDSWFRGRIQTNINGAVKYIKELETALEEPALCPEYLNSGSGAATDKKNRTFFGGTWTETYSGRTCYWLTRAWTKPEAVRKMKHSFACSRREPTGCSREPDYLAASVKCTNQFATAEEAKAWKEEKIAWYED